MLLITEVAIRFDTEEDMDLFLKNCEKENITWLDGRYATEFNPYMECEEEICITIRVDMGGYIYLVYDSVDYYKAIGRKILNFEKIKGRII